MPPKKASGAAKAAKSKAVKNKQPEDEIIQTVKPKAGRKAKKEVDLEDLPSEPFVELSQSVEPKVARRAKKEIELPVAEEVNSDSEQIAAPKPKGRPAKKDAVAKEVKPKSTKRGKTEESPVEENDLEDEVVEAVKPKAAKRGKKEEPQTEEKETEEEIEVDAKPKASKRGKIEEPQIEEKENKEEIVDAKSKPTKRGKKEEPQVEEKENEEEIVNPKKTTRGKIDAQKVNGEEETEEKVPIKAKPGRKKKETVDEKPEIKEKEKVSRKRKSDEDDLEEPVVESKTRNLRKQKETVYKDDDEEKVKKAAPAKKKAGPKSKSKKEAPKEEQNIADEKPATGRKAPKRTSPVEEPKAKMANNVVTDWELIDFAYDESKCNFKITSWNVAGIKSWLKKECLRIINYDNPDILCLQETKCNLEDIPDELVNLEGYKTYWSTGKTKGYGGVGICTKVMPIEVIHGIGDEEHDDEGRCISAEFKKFYLVNVYVPNSGRGLVTLPKRLSWNEAFKNFIKKLDEKKPVILCGDMNVAHGEIDLANPKTNKKSAGFTPEERQGMTEFISNGFVDTFRHFYPEKEDSYTFWTYLANARAKNVGWRLDYFLVSERLMENIHDQQIYDEVFGSDHCPISLSACF